MRGIYLIEEIAIILQLSGRATPRYEVSIFNYPPPLLLQLYSGAHADLFADITNRIP